MLCQQRFHLSLKNEIMAIGDELATRGDWRREFRRQFSELTHRWEFKHVLNLPPLELGWGERWRQCQGKGKVQFSCRNCYNTWSSLNGVAVFQYILKHGLYGEVNMQLMGQKCRSCSSEVFEVPEWYKQEMSIAVSTLLAKVKEKCYGVKSRHDWFNDRHIEGEMNGPHLPHLCQACEKGVCRENKNDSLDLSLTLGHRTHSDCNDHLPINRLSLQDNRNKTWLRQRLPNVPVVESRERDTNNWSSFSPEGSPDAFVYKVIMVVFVLFLLLSFGIDFVFKK